MPDPQEITRYCSSLVIVVSTLKHLNENSPSFGIVQLAHLSVKEYLTSDRLEFDIASNFREPKARSSIAKACLAYLLHFKEGLPALHVVQGYPFAHYSARYWMANAAEAEDNDNKMLELVEQLFCYRELSYNICYSLHRPDAPWLYKLEGKAASAIYYAAFRGFIQATKGLADKGANVNARGGRYGNVLQAAIAKGHKDVAKVLRNKGASHSVW